MKLLLIRHGQTTSNVLGLLDSRVPGPDLTELGWIQARAIPRAFSSMPVTSLTASTMVRTVQTGTPLADSRALSIGIDPGLREIEGGELEMASGPAALRAYTDVAWAWGGGDLNARMAGAEDGHEFFDRFDEAVDRCLRLPGELPAVVSHGGSIRVWVGHRCENVGSSFAAESELHNTGWAVVDREPAGVWRLLEWNAFPAGGRDLHARSGPDDDGPTGSATIAEGDEIRIAGPDPRHG